MPWGEWVPQAPYTHNVRTLGVAVNYGYMQRQTGTPLPEVYDAVSTGEFDSGWREHFDNWDGAGFPAFAPLAGVRFEHWCQGEVGDESGTQVAQGLRAQSIWVVELDLGTYAEQTLPRLQFSATTGTFDGWTGLTAGYDSVARQLDTAFYWPHMGFPLGDLTWALDPLPVFRMAVIPWSSGFQDLTLDANAGAPFGWIPDGSGFTFATGTITADGADVTLTALPADELNIYNPDHRMVIFSEIQLEPTVYPDTTPDPGTGYTSAPVGIRPIPMMQGTDTPPDYREWVASLHTVGGPWGLPVGALRVNQPGTPDPWPPVQRFP